MKCIGIMLIFISSNGYSQLTVKMAQDSAVRKYHIGSYSYHEKFIGHRGYGAPIILTTDGGGAVFGDGDEGIMLVKLNKTGKLQWKRTLPPKGDETESQSVVQDKLGNYYVFMLVYDNSKYRGGCERVVFLNASGTIVWDRLIGSCDLLNNPTVSYIRALSDGRIAMRGHIVTEKPQEGKDPAYHYWEGWLGSKGTLTQKSGEIIDWSDKEWEKKYNPD